MTTFAFIDTETDGLGPNRHVWEAAIITVDHINTDHETTKHTHLYLPLDPSHTDGQALAIGGFWQRHPMAVQALTGADAKPGPTVTPLGPAAAKILRATHEAIIVGVTPAFDTQSLERILRGTGLAPTWDYRLIDLRALAMGYLLGKGESVDELIRSDELSRRCGVAPPDADERHTAMGDAEWAHRWFLQIAAGRDASEQTA